MPGKAKPWSILRYNKIMLEVMFIIVAVALGIAGILGSVMPAIPGPPLGFAGLLVIHFVNGGIFPTGFLVLMGALTVAAVLMDYALPLLGAKMYGATKFGIAGSFIGMLAGLLILNLPGMIVGMFLGAVTGEYIAGQKTGQALRSGTASFVGGLSAMALKLALSIVMAVYIVLNIT